jgi:zinc transport system substrate-binding protein
LIGCSTRDGGEGEGAGRTGDVIGVVEATNYPLAYFAERVASPLVEVRYRAADAGDPAYWRPTPEDIAAMQQADLVLLNGASYERWLADVSLPPSRLVDTSAGFREQYIPLAETVTHSHGMEGEHEHSGTAFTTWMDLSLAVEQALVLTEALAKRWPEHAALFQDQLAALKADLEAIDQSFMEVVSADPGRPVVFSHPVYQYFERRYGANGKSVHWEPDAMPDEGMWDELAELRKDHPAEWMVWEGEPLEEIRAKLEETGVRSVVVNPCGNAPEDGDFLSVMRANAAELRRAYE